MFRESDGQITEGESAAEYATRLLFEQLASVDTLGVWIEEDDES